MSRERKQRHDDAHYPLAGKGKRANRRQANPCQHRLLLLDGTCATCGAKVRP